MVIFVLVDGAKELFGTVVDRCQWEGIERGLIRLAPEDIVSLKWPVAEGDKDMVELQSLGLMDGDETDAADHIALDGF